MEQETRNWKVYLIRCADDTYYCGVTSKKIEERIQVHNSGTGSKYTRARLPVSLLSYKDQLTRSEACKLEYKIKRLPKNRKINYLDSIM